MKNIGIIIREERLRQGMTLKRLSEMSKCTDRAIAYYEAGRTPNLEIIDRILKALNISIVIGIEKERKS